MRGRGLAPFISIGRGVYRVPGTRIWLKNIDGKFHLLARYDDTWTTLGVFRTRMDAMAFYRNEVHLTPDTAATT